MLPNRRRRLCFRSAIAMSLVDTRELSISARTEKGRGRLTLREWQTSSPSRRQLPLWRALFPQPISQLFPRGRLLVLLLWTLLLSSACKRSAESWIEEGTAALQADKLEEASKAFHKALDQNPLEPRALYGAGWVSHLQRESAASRVYFERCVEVAPEFYGGYKGLGSVHLAQGYLEQAEASFQRALELSPGDPSVLGSLGYVYLVRKQLDKAEATFSQALKEAPERGELYYMMAELRSRQGLNDEALTLLAEGRKRHIEERKFLALLGILEGQLRLQQALKGLEDNTLPPDSADRQARVALLQQADKALTAALPEARAEELSRAQLLRRKVRKALERLQPPPE